MKPISYKNIDLPPISPIFPTNVCNNCGKPGHLIHQCKLPITSYGFIAFRYFEGQLKFLMVKRKDSFGYIDFMRGKYSIYNADHLQNTVNEMSMEEKQNLLVQPFELLWKKLWCETTSSFTQHINEHHASSKKCETLRQGGQLQYLVQNSTTQWADPEWEFPKGRRNNKEKDLECAYREFVEETGIHRQHMSIVENMLPFEELFVGSDGKTYKYKYYLTHIKENVSIDQFQKTEIGQMEWKTLEQCLEIIRPYHIEKKKLIQKISNVLNKYRLYC